MTDTKKKILEEFDDRFTRDGVFGKQWTVREINPVIVEEVKQFIISKLQEVERAIYEKVEKEAAEKIPKLILLNKLGESEGRARIDSKALERNILDFIAQLKGEDNERI